MGTVIAWIFWGLAILALIFFILACIFGMMAKHCKKQAMRAQAVHDAMLKGVHFEEYIKMPMPKKLRKALIEREEDYIKKAEAKGYTKEFAQAYAAARYRIEYARTHGEPFKEFE